MFSDDINEALFDFVVVSVETPFPSKTNGKNLQNKFKKKLKKKTREKNLEIERSKTTCIRCRSRRVRHLFFFTYKLNDERDRGGGRRKNISTN